MNTITLVRCGGCGGAYRNDAFWRCLDGQRVHAGRYTCEDCGHRVHVELDIVSNLEFRETLTTMDNLLAVAS